MILIHRHPPPPLHPFRVLLRHHTSSGVSLYLVWRSDQESALTRLMLWHANGPDSALRRCFGDEECDEHLGTLNSRSGWADRHIYADEVTRSRRTGLSGP